MLELIDFRNTLIHEIDAGWYDALSWQACAVWAREIGCYSIQAQVEGYIEHYGKLDKWLNDEVMNRTGDCKNQTAGLIPRGSTQNT